MPRDPFAGPRPVTGTFKGKRLRGVWNRIYCQDPSETFHEFLIDLLKLTLGEEWIGCRSPFRASGRPPGLGLVGPGRLRHG